MIDPGILLTYITACTVIIISPGPAQVMVTAVTLSDGKKAGITTVLGLNSSVVIHILAAAAGVSALLAASAEAFTAVKYLGAAYLIYIGIKSLLGKSTSEKQNQNFDKNKNINNYPRLFSNAFLTGILNPKVALFFLAFVPQFVNPGKGFIILQFLILGFILAGIDIIYETILVLLIEKIRTKIIGNNLFIRVREKISGLVMIAMGIWMVLMKQE